MFRSESHQERMLLRLIESQQRQIERLQNRLMYLIDKPWEVPEQFDTAADVDEIPDDFQIPELEAVDTL